MLAAFLMGLLIVAPFAITMAVWRNRNAQRDSRSATVELVVDEFGVRRELADGREEGIDWSEINEVEVYRLTNGPHGRSGGMVMLSGDATRGCLVPLDQLATVVEGLSHLPGLDLKLLTEAVEVRPPAQTVVWRRSS